MLAEVKVQHIVVGGSHGLGGEEKNNYIVTLPEKIRGLLRRKITEGK